MQCRIRKFTVAGKKFHNRIWHQLSFETFDNIMVIRRYDSIATVGEIRVYWRADFQSGSRVLKKVF